MSLFARNVEQPKRITVPELRVGSGECLVICGPNGSGKSSLLRLLAGVDRPSRGEVTWDTRSLVSMTPMERAAHIAWLPQRSTLSGTLTVESLVACARYRFFESEQVAQQHALTLLGEHDLLHLAGRLTSEISGGELQRVLIVSLVAQQAAVLMLDEPANHLDPKHQISTYQTLGRLWRAGQSVIIVSHDVRLAQLLGDSHRVRVLGIKHGQLVFEQKLAAPDLYESLGVLYESRFVPPGQPGSLAVDLSAAADFKDNL